MIVAALTHAARDGTPKGHVGVTLEEPTVVGVLALKGAPSGVGERNGLPVAGQFPRQMLGVLQALEPP